MERREGTGIVRLDVPYRCSYTDAVKPSESAVGRQRDHRPDSVVGAEVDRWARRLAADVKLVLTRHPEADPEDVRLTLICLQSSPLERLNRSLRRGRGFAAFRK